MLEGADHAGVNVRVVEGNHVLGVHLLPVDHPYEGRHVWARPVAVAPRSFTRHFVVVVTFFTPDGTPCWSGVNLTLHVVAVRKSQLK